MSSDGQEQLLARAVEAARNGDRAEARKLVEDILATDPENVKAWTLLYRISDDVNEKRMALTSVLQLDPNNAGARQALDKLNERLGETPDDEVIPGVSRRQLLLFGGIGAAVVLLLIVVVLALAGGQNAAEQGQLANLTQAARTSTAFAVNPSLTAEQETLVAVNATATELAINTPTPSLTPTRVTSNELPPTFTPTPTEAPFATPTSLSPPPAAASGVIVARGGPDQLNDGYLQILAIPVQDSAASRVISGGTRGNQPSANSSALFYYPQYFEQTFETSLALVNTTTGSTELLAQRWSPASIGIFESDEPSLSTDGSVLVFSAETIGSRQRREVLLINLNAPGLTPGSVTLQPGQPIDTAVVRQLTSDEFDYSFPAISPNGARVVATQTDTSTGAVDLVLIDIASRQISPLTSDGNVTIEEMPTWSPDGSIIAYTVRGQGETDRRLVINVRGGALPGVYDVPTGSGDSIYPQFSPDGRYIAFSNNRTGVYNIFIYDLNQADAELVITQVTNAEDDVFVGSWVSQ